MKTKMKKTAVVLMSLIMVMCYMPMMAFADSGVTTEAQLQEAIETGGTVNLGGDIELTKTLKLASGAVTINGNNHTLKAADSFQSVDKNAVIWVNGGQLTLNNVTVDANSKARAILDDAGKLTINTGTTITGGYVKDNYIAGVYVTSKASFEMTGGEISGNTIEGTYSNDGDLQYSADLWIGANAQGTMAAISGGKIGNVFVNSNEYSANNPGSFVVSGGIIDTLVVENDKGYDGDFTLQGGTVETLIVKSEANLRKNIVSTTGQVDTIKLGKNIDAADSFTVPAGKTITLDLNGKTMTTTKGHNIINNGNLTIKDSASGGKIDSSIKAASALQNEPNATAVIESGTLVKSRGVDSSDYYVITNHGTMTINGGTINSASSNSSAIENGWYTAGDNSGKTNSIMVINGGTVANNGTKANGGLYTLKNDDYGVMTINGGTFNNTTADAGTMLNWNEATINGGIFNAENVSVATMSESSSEDASKPKHPYELGKTSITDGEFNAGLGSNEAYSKAIEVLISGGTFAVEPKSEYIAPGYVVEALNGKFVVKSKTNIPTPTPTPDDNVTSNPGDKTTTADVETSTGADGKATATVDKTTADKIVEKAIENKSEQVIIDATTKGDAKTAEVKLPAETVKALVEKTDADVVIKTDAAEVVLDQKAAAAVADQAKTGNVMIVVDKVKEDDSQVHFELKVVTDNGNVTDFKGGSVKVTVALPAALKDKEVVCVYIDEKGSYTKVSGVKNADGTYTFTTGHFSTYAVMTAEEADKVIKEQEKAKNDRLKAGVKATTLKASSTAKKGSISIKWKKSYGYKVDYFQVFRSTKKDSGYGTKAFYTTKSGTQTTYKNTKQVKKGTRYYYKVRGVRTIDGVKVYTKWSSKAIRTAK